MLVQTLHPSLVPTTDPQLLPWSKVKVIIIFIEAEDLQRM